MASLTGNSLPTMLAIFAQRSIPQFITSIPMLKNVFLDLSEEVAAGGQIVHTRVPTTIFSTPGDLTNGWPDTNFTASDVSITLKAGVFNHKFDELQWTTITPTLLEQVTFPSLIGQLANGVIVDLLTNVTSSTFTKTITMNSASNFSLSTLQSGSNYLTTLEAPFENRMALLTPNAYQSLVASIPYAYQYGTSEPMQAYHGLRIAGFDPVLEYPRLVNSTPTPGGAYVNLSTDKPVAFCIAKNGLVFAGRQPVDVNYGSTWTGTATQNGISLQYRIAYDNSKPLWRVAAVSIYGSAAGSPSGVVPVLSLSTQ